MVVVVVLDVAMVCAVVVTGCVGALLIVDAVFCVPAEIAGNGRNEDEQFDSTWKSAHPSSATC